ncbi:MAG: LPS assembly lipoprotein LptE [Nitrospira sp.]|nr:LPS assembly lipoprotein LptE [Nitrospira sp.]
MLGAEFTVNRNQERRGPFVPILSTLVSALIASTLAACGYQFRVEGAGPTIGGTSATSSQEPPPRLIIRTLINGSFEPNLETRYTNYLRDEFSAGSGAQVVPESEAADLVLTGQILSVIMPTLSFTRAQTLESRTEVVVLARVEDARSKKVVWSQVVKGASEFFITTDLQFNRVLQNRAIEQAGRFVAADLAARFLLQLETGALTKQVSAPDPVSH